jgi:hypothetical protein
MAIQEYQLPGWYKGAERRFSHQQRCARTSFTRRSCSHLRPMKIRANAIRVDVRDRGRGEPSLILLHYYGGRSEPGMRLSTDLWTSTDRSRSTTVAGEDKTRRPTAPEAGGRRDPAICFQDLDRLGSLISFGLARNYYF